MVKVVVADGFCGDEGWGLEWLSGNWRQQIVVTVSQLAGEGRVWWLPAALQERPWSYRAERRYPSAWLRSLREIAGKGEDT